MLRCLPRSTLFPYTTLFRSGGLRRLFAGEVDAAVGKEGLALSGCLEGLVGRALRRELEDPGPVGVEPQLDQIGRAPCRGGEWSAAGEVAGPRGGGRRMTGRR